MINVGRSNAGTVNRPIIILIISAFLYTSASLDFQCSEPEIFENGFSKVTTINKDLGQVFISFQTAHFFCNPGYALNGTSKSVCINGNWSHPSPACIKIEHCADPRVSADGEREGNCCDHGSILSYTCNEGYSLIGSKQIKCESGIWTERRPRCRPEFYCENPPSVGAGYIKGQKIGDYFLPYDEIEIICYNGYTINNGSDYLFCKEDGKWDSDFALCEEATCDVPAIPENGNIRELEHSIKDRYPYKFQLNYNCDDGYRLIGLNWRECTDFGWSGKDPRCEEIKCYNPGVPENGWRKGDSFAIGSKITFGCFSGYTILGSEERICLPNGQWNGELSRCDAKYNYCPNPGIPINGARDGDSFNNGDKVQFLCNPEFLIVGSEIRICQENGTWTGTEVFCRGQYDFDNKNDASVRIQMTIKDKMDEQEKLKKQFIEEFINTDDYPYPDAILSNHLPRSGDGRSLFMSADRGPSVHHSMLMHARVLDLNPSSRLVLYFVFDASGSVGKENFKTSISFAKALVRKMGVSEHGSRVGALKFSSKASMEFLPLDYSTTEEVLTALDEIKYTAGGTATSSALRLVREEMIPLVQATLHSELKSVIFILTDGKANMGGDPEAAADELKKAGVEIYCIGITGNPQHATLYKIASSISEHVFLLDSFKTLSWLIDEITVGTIDYSVCGLGLEAAAKKARRTKRSTINAINARVIGGDKVQTPWPWMAGLYIKVHYSNDANKAKLKCGGSIIGHKWILTAAHCLYKKSEARYVERNPEDIIVKLGLTHVSNESNIQEFEVEAIIIHPSFNTTTIDYDIAVLKLTRPIEYNTFVRPICLPTEELVNTTALYQAGENAFAIGWGHNKRMKSVNNDYLQDRLAPVQHLKEVMLPLQPRHICQMSLVNSKTRIKSSFTERMICAGSGQGDKDTCKGDSGGPLMQSQLNEHGNVFWTQIGIVSWGEGCGNIGSYGFYTYVSVLTDWIDEQMYSE